MIAVHDFLRVVMLSSRILPCLLSVKKQKHDFQYFFRSMYKISFSVLDLVFVIIQNNQGLGKGYNNPTSTLIIRTSEKPHPIIVYSFAGS